jgi:hypothetical protein
MISRSTEEVWSQIAATIQGLVARWHAPGTVDRAFRLMLSEVDAGPIFQMLIVLDRLGVPERLAGRVDLFDVFDYFLEERGILDGMVDGTQQPFLAFFQFRRSVWPAWYC